jgi:hypothetical protein
MGGKPFSRGNKKHTIIFIVINVLLLKIFCILLMGLRLLTENSFF